MLPLLNTQQSTINKTILPITEQSAGSEKEKARLSTILQTLFVAMAQTLSICCNDTDTRMLQAEPNTASA
eukprot:5109317-Ditylum_brightwellii.AAC.1